MAEFNDQSYTMEQMQAVLAKAMDLANNPGGVMPVQWFYCDLMQFLDQEETIKTDERMPKQLSDKSGKPRCPINGQLEGIRFMVNVDYSNGLPFQPSPYGNRRLRIPIVTMLEKCPNLYFADVFCYGQHHHVFLVMTRSASSADEICSKRLPKLEWLNNPFLYMKRTATSSKLLIPRHGIWIDLLFTEDLEGHDFANAIWEDVEMTTFKWDKGPLHRKSKLLRKRTNCVKCNLPP